jgi:hypothetical protein
VNADERATEILKLLDKELPKLLQGAVDDALHRSPQTVALVTELEASGYQVNAGINYTLWVTPVELAFGQSLTDYDRAFLHGLWVEPPDEAK